jgi:predicted dithiol-disulfide oxidoreductase (DUF899 family)
MRYNETVEQLALYRRQIAELREKMRQTQAAVEPEEVANYEFATPEGTLPLSALFGGKPDLIVIHNMGASCAYCTHSGPMVSTVSMIIWPAERDLWFLVLIVRRRRGSLPKAVVGGSRW